MNQARKSAVRAIPYESLDYSLVQTLCTQNVDDNVTNSKSGKWLDFKKLLMKVLICYVWLNAEMNSIKNWFLFYFKVSQPCEDMLIACRYGGFDVNCMEIFSSILTDEGLCCIFNGLSTKFTLKDQYRSLLEFNTSDNLQAEETFWSPESGYPEGVLNNNKYISPTPAIGTRIQIIIDHAFVIICILHYRNG